MPLNKETKTFWEFLSPTLADGFSLESDKQVPLSLQDSSQYSSWSQLCSCFGWSPLVLQLPSPPVLVPIFWWLYQAHHNYNWYHCYFHAFQFPSKVQVLIPLDFLSVDHRDKQSRFEYQNLTGVFVRLNLKDIIIFYHYHYYHYYYLYFLYVHMNICIIQVYRLKKSIWWRHNYMLLTFYLPMGCKHCNNDGKEYVDVWWGTMLKNKPHLVTFNELYIVYIYIYI